MCARATTAGVGTWRHWFALLGGAVAWTGHLLLAYAIAEFGCTAGLGHRTLLAVSVVSWMLLGMSAVMTAMALGALLVSKGVRDRAAAPGPDADDRATAEYVGRFGLIANGLFLFIILVESIPIFFYLGRC